MKKTVSLLLLLALALSLCACGEVSPAPAESSQPLDPPDHADSEAPQLPEDIVVTAFEKSGDYTDSLGNEYHYSYRIPAINAEPEEARRLNELIYTQLMSVVDEELKSMDDGLSLVSVNVDYRYYVNDGIVSILCTSDSPNDFNNYLVCNYDAGNDREFTRADFLAREGLTEEELVSLACATCEQTFTEAFGNFPHDSFYEEQYARTLDPSTYGDDLMLYYGEDGTLSMVAPIFSLAGASFYYQEIAVR